MKKLILLVMVLGLLASGCATTQQMAFNTNDRLTEREVQQQFASDNYQCVQESKTYWSGGGSGLVGLTIIATAQVNADWQAKQLWIMCMKSKGYIVIEVPKGKSWMEYSMEEKIKVTRALCPDIPINEESLKSSKNFKEYRISSGYSVERCLGK